MRKIFLEYFMTSVSHVHSCGMNHSICDAEFLVHVRLAQDKWRIARKD